MEENISLDNRTITKSLTWKMLEKTMSYGINFIIQIILARMLLPEDFGSLAIISTIVNYAGIFVQSGLSTAIIQKKYIEDIDISTLLILSLGVAAILYFLLFMSAPLISEIYKTPKLVWPIRVLALTLFLNAVNSVQMALYSRKLEFKKLFFRTTIAVAVSGLTGIFMAYMNCGIWALVMQNFIYLSVVVLVMSINNRISFRFCFSLARARVLYGFSGKILLSSLLSGAHDAVRTMFIAKEYSSTDLAYYDKANTYSFYISRIVNDAIAGVLLPVFSRKQTDKAELRRMARKSTKMTAYIMFPVLFGIVATADMLVKIFLTDKWVGCITFLRIFCILRMLNCISSIDKQVFLALGRSDIILCLEIFVFVLNISFLLNTLPHGILMIAIGVLWVEIIYEGVVWFISSRIYVYSMYMHIKDIIKPFINSVIMCMIILKMPRFYNVGYLSFQILIGISVYLLLSFVLHDDNLQELSKIINGALGKH